MNKLNSEIIVPLVLILRSVPRTVKITTFHPTPYRVKTTSNLSCHLNIVFISSGENLLKIPFTFCNLSFRPRVYKIQLLDRCMIVSQWLKQIKLSWTLQHALSNNAVSRPRHFFIGNNEHIKSYCSPPFYFSVGIN